MQEVIKHSLTEKENFSKELSRTSLGWIVKELFGDHVSMVQRGPRENRQRAYPNLQRRNEVREHYRTVADFVARNVPNSWHVIDDGTDQLSIIRHWEFNEQRGTVEFRVMNKKAEELSLQVKAHGCSVNLKKDLGLKRILNSMPMEKQIVLAIKFIESSSLCFGFQVEQGENVMTLLPSYLRSLIKNNEAKECQRIFAENCLVLATSTEICPNCARVLKVDKNRRKRKAEQTLIHPFCNKRFLSKQEVECQLKAEQIARRNAEKKRNVMVGKI